MITALMWVNGFSMVLIPIAGYYAVEMLQAPRWWALLLLWPLIAMWLQGRLSRRNTLVGDSGHVGWSDPGSGGGPHGWAGG